MCKKKILNIALIVIIIIMCAPMVACTLYTYPVQDDFYNTWNVYQTMNKGYSSFAAAFLMAVRGYTNYSGYYFSLFLTYFSDALIKCDIWGIRICQCAMAICFYLSVYFLLRTILVKVFVYDKQRILPIITLFFTCLTSLYYFVEHEDFLWFCASVIYLIPMICLLVGIISMVYAIDMGKPGYAIISMVLGFLVGGAVLNIAALGCILYVMTAYWGIVVKKRIKLSVCTCVPMLAGGILNVVAPGNFVRKGGALTLDEIWLTAIGTYHYILSRIKMFLLHYPLFVVVFVILVFLLLLWKPGKTEYKFYIPVVFSVLMFLAVWIVIYPVALGYGMDIYYMMERSNFISDFTIFLVAFLALFYWRGWLAVKFPDLYIKIKNPMSSRVFIGVLLIIGILLSAKMDHISSLRIYRELFNGEIAEFSKWNVDVIKAFEEKAETVDESNTIKVYVTPMEDTTCMINPKFYYGCFDSTTEPYNGSMARFYGLDAVYMFDETE